MSSEQVTLTASNRIQTQDIICRNGSYYSTTFEAPKNCKLIKESRNIEHITEFMEPIDDILEKESNNQFRRIQVLLAQPNVEYVTVAQVLENLIEFSSDNEYKLKLLDHGLFLLKGLLLDRNPPIHVKEVVARTLEVSLRNNSAAIEFINCRDANIVNELLQEATHYINNGSKETNILVNRYLSIITTLLSMEPRCLDEELLEKLYFLNDEEIKVKVLLLVCLFRHVNKSNPQMYNNFVTSPRAREWMNRISHVIQDDRLEEFQVRELFYGLYHLRKNSDLRQKLYPGFTEWLMNESFKRKKCSDKLLESDKQQDEFNKLLINSRHLIFGNPMAHRVHNFEEHDEL